ncbi:MAG: histidinol-phosphatase HisJ family protein [Lachnospiraceae bacterium]|nr:histidinol-phosphatase HisJ family protein [Lachnospiraceae bacterium]
MLWDTHMHTHFSGDSEALPSDMIKSAYEKGLSGICFTDHIDYDYIEPDKDLFVFDIDDYFAEMLPLAHSFKGKFPINIGVELGLQPHVAEQNEELVTSYPFDFVIGSSHMVHGLDPYYPEYFRDRDNDTGVREYFESIIENIKAYENFDVYGHLDYIIRYSPMKTEGYSYQKYSDVIDEILKLLISKGKGIEINTAGYKYGLGQPNPTADIIKRYKSLGGEIITLGADAHKPEHVAYDFDKLPALLKECGFDYFCVFKERKPSFIKLD